MDEAACGCFAQLHRRQVVHDLLGERWCKLVQTSGQHLLGRRIGRDRFQQVLSCLISETLTATEIWSDAPFSTSLSDSSQSRIAIFIVRSSPNSSIHLRSFVSAREVPMVDSGRPLLSLLPNGGPLPPAAAYTR